jgi:DNA-binding transcriptional ArsR family regulator
VDSYQDADGFAALGDPTRRAIVACLAEGPRAVVELAAVLPVSRPAVSQHLKILKEAGLVSERAVGTRRIYRLNPAAVAALRDQLDTFWSRALASYADVVTPVGALAADPPVDLNQTSQVPSEADGAVQPIPEEKA